MSLSLSLSHLLRGQWRRLYHTRECFGHWNKQHIRKHEIPKEWLDNRSSHSNLWRLVTAYRDYGHTIASTDPLNDRLPIVPSQLSLDYYGLDKDTLSPQLYNTTGLLYSYEGREGSLNDVIDYLKRVYCDTIAIEVQHINDPIERDWLLQCYESHVTTPFPPDQRPPLATKLLKSQIFDQFLAKKFGTVKRYGAEGAESMIGFIEETLVRACEGGVSDVIIGMPHRGRLNLLVDTLQYPLTALFNKMKGNSEFPSSVPATGDVLSHLTSSVDIQVSPDHAPVHVTMVPNPSHLEAVNPVVMGKSRARMLSLQCGPYYSSTSIPTITNGREKGEKNDNTDKSKVLCVQVHGDAAFSAQGVVMECLAISNTPHYEVGGAIHLIVNNYLGFTTPPEHGRSSSHSSDVGKMIGCPVIHVNGNHPEEVIKACRIAMDYRQEYEKDVIVLLNCYRRWGHNEVDDPSMTQPLMYKHIDALTTVPDMYWEQHSSSLEDKSTVTQQYYDHLNTSLKESDNYTPKMTSLQCQWSGMELSTDHITQWDTGLPVDLLKYIGAKSVEVPETLSVHSRLQRAHIQDRLNKIQRDTIDWSTAESMALGSLLYQGFNVRLSGQDVGRGTFSHRHVMLVDQETTSAYIPLNNMRVYNGEQRNFIEVANSPLSEEAVLGYEYGYSIESPQHLVLWEAQFGDFFNGGQIIIDTFISSGEDKWMLQSGLVMLLPHGYDGAGPEHSSCRIERFLQNTNSREEGIDSDSVNMHIAHPTTPSQYYHLLRRQMIRPFRKPLIVQSPKTLLRLSRAVSSLNHMSSGTSFIPVLGDDNVDPDNVQNVILCSGKHYYALDDYRKTNNINDTAIIRLELLCPFPAGALHNELKKYRKAKKFIWSQEEPANMGVWSFVEPRIRKQLGINNLYRVSRGPYGPPASGIGVVHQKEVKSLFKDTFHHHQ